MSHTIQARVSEKILHKADRLFNNSLSQVLVELLQNARRAGASLVTVTTKVIEPTITEITSDRQRVRHYRLPTASVAGRFRLEEGSRGP